METAVAYGLIGHPLGHSVSPMLHAMLGDYEYRLLDTEGEALDRLLRERSFRGLNVTIPYKQTVLPYCDELGEEVRRAGSANVLLNREGRLIARNTDLYGFSCLLDSLGVDPRGKKAVILGSGGTSKTARCVLEERGAVPVVISRSGPVTYEELYALHADARLLVNTTPVGMYPNTGASPARLSRLPLLEAVFDAVYNPPRTALLLEAEKLGIPHIGGLRMLVAQAAAASALFTGKPMAEESVLRAIEEKVTVFLAERTHRTEENAN